MNIVLWLFFGALAGWIASLIMNTDEQQGAVLNIIVGIAGAVIGGFLFEQLFGGDVSGFNIGSLLVAIIGAAILLAVVKVFRRRSIT